MGQLTQIFTLVLWLAFVDYSLQVDIRPELNLVTPTVTLLANSTFEVQCTGYFPLHWIYPADWRSLIASKAQVNETQDSNSIKPYVSTLTIEDLEYRFTGRYICASTIGVQPDEENFDDEDSASASIYLYVFDDDHLLAPLSNKSTILTSFSVFASRTLIIPCRPTRPEIIVQLTGSATDLIETAIFDPRRGFIFERPSVELEGIMFCHAFYENNKNESHMLFLRFQDEKTVTPEVAIDDSAAKYPTVGEPFTLDCVVHKDRVTMVVIDWNYPTGNDDVEIGNTTVGVLSLRSQESIHRMSKKLEVSKATQNHTGFYTCTVITLIRSYSKSVYLNIRENNTSDLSETDTDASRTDTDASRTDTDASRTDSDATRTDTDASRTDTDASRTNTDASRTDTDASRTDTDASRTDTDASRTDTDALRN